MIAGEVEYCPECGWGVTQSLFPGNNGLVEKQWCSYCGWFGVI